jgi:hypothetical protein
MPLARRGKPELRFSKDARGIGVEGGRDCKEPAPNLHIWAASPEMRQSPKRKCRGYLHSFRQSDKAGGE